MGILHGLMTKVRPLMCMLSQRMHKLLNPEEKVLPVMYNPENPTAMVCPSMKCLERGLFRLVGFQGLAGYAKQ
jgi:hypothetical protein